MGSAIAAAIALSLAAGDDLRDDGDRRFEGAGWAIASLVGIGLATVAVVDQRSGVGQVSAVLGSAYGATLLATAVTLRVLHRTAPAKRIRGRNFFDSPDAALADGVDGLDLAGRFAIAFAVDVIAGLVAGGIAAFTARDPGTPRVATGLAGGAMVLIAVPLLALW